MGKVTNLGALRAVNSSVSQIRSMLAKALGDALEQTDFFVSNQENDVSVDNVHNMPGMSPSVSKNSGARANQSSIWTDDGLSLSVESASDIDMT